MNVRKILAAVSVRHRSGRISAIVGSIAILSLSCPAHAQFSDGTISSANDLISQERALRNMCNSAACFGAGSAAGAGSAVNGAMAAQKILSNGMAAMGTQLLLDALFDSGADEAAAAAAQAQAQAAERARVAAEEQRTDGIRDRLLTQMQGVSTAATTNLPLMGTDQQTASTGGLQLMQSDTAPGQTAVDLDNSGQNARLAMQDATPDEVAEKFGVTTPSPQTPSGNSTTTVDPNRKVALIPRQGDPEHLAKGSRYVDCKATLTAYVRLQSGMAAQNDWLNRTKARLDGAKRESAKIGEKARTAAFKALFSTTEDLAQELGVLRNEVSRIPMDKLTPAKREAILKWANWTFLTGDAILNSPEAFKAGKELGENGKEISADAMEQVMSSAQGRKYIQALPKLSQDFGDAVLHLGKAMVDSGIASEIVKDHAKEALGPWSVLAFTAGEIGIDAVEVGAESALNEQEIQQAYWQYDHLHDLYGAIQARIEDDHADLAQYCGGGSVARSGS